MAYNEAERAVAVEIIHRYGGLTRDAIADIRAALNAPGLSKSTLHGWLPRVNSETEPNRRTSAEPASIEPTKKVQVAPSPQARKQANRTLEEMFQAVAENYLGHALDESIVANTKGKDAVMTAAIAVDKLFLIRNLTPQIIELLPLFLRWHEALIGQGFDPATVLTRMVTKVEIGGN